MFLNPADAPKLLHPKCRSPQLHTPRIGYEEAASPTRTLTLNRKPQTPKPPKPQTPETLLPQHEGHASTGGRPGVRGPFQWGFGAYGAVEA